MIGSPIIALVLAVSMSSAMDTASEAEPVEQPAIDAALRPIVIDQVFPYWTDYLGLPEAQRQAFTLRYNVTGPEHWALWLAAPEGTLSRLGGWPDTELHPPALTHFNRNAILHVETANAGGMRVSMVMEPTAALAAQYQVSDLLAAMEQAQRAMRSITGAASLFAPRMDTITFAFEGPAPEAVAILRSGSHIELPVEGSTVRFPAHQRPFRDAVRLVFGDQPIKAEITPR